MHSQLACIGYCSKCETSHSLNRGNSHTHALTLMDALSKYQTIDFEQQGIDHHPYFSTASLFGEARGKMFGVLECVNIQGETITLKAFSWQYNGNWLVPGWVPPLFSTEEFYLVNDETEKKIKALTYEIQNISSQDSNRQTLVQARKRLSQTLMIDLHKLYTLHNFRVKNTSIFDAFTKNTGIPTGVGDCCAPKLLNYAAQNNLTPIGLTEFYWGKTNKSGSKKHGFTYTSCKEKCEPILGFLLCGLEEKINALR